MRVVLDRESSDIINVTEMEDGDVAQIVKWNFDVDNIGHIVQRYKDILITIGQDSGQSYSSIFKPNSYEKLRECNVKLLKPGDVLRIKE